MCCARVCEPIQQCVWSARYTLVDWFVARLFINRQPEEETASARVNEDIVLDCPLNCRVDDNGEAVADVLPMHGDEDAVITLRSDLPRLRFVPGPAASTRSSTH